MSSTYQVVFVDFSNNFFDRHAVYCLSAYLKARHIQVHYLNARTPSKALARLRQINPQLLLYSAYSRDIASFIRFDKIVKETLRVKSVIGGAGPTFDWQFLKNSTIDALCVGEGESALVHYVENGLEASKNIIGRDQTPAEFFPFIQLDDCPFPDRELVYQYDYVLRNIPSKQFLSGRGCPYICTYCHNNIQNKMFKRCGPIIRKKSVDYLIEEIKEVRRRYPLKSVSFQDDTFILQKKWLFEFCDRFPKEVGLPYTCNIRANLVDEDIVAALKASGCACAYWSIESGNDTIRNTLLKRHISRDQIYETARLLNKYKLIHRSGGIIGLPGETFDQMLETLEMNIAVKPGFGFAMIFVPYPGLELTQYAIRHQYMKADSLNRLPDNFHSRSAMDIPETDNIRIQKLAFLYSIFVGFPKLYHLKPVRNMLFRLPRNALYVLNEVYSGFVMSRLYRVKTALGLKLAIIWRYLWNPF